MSSTWCTPKYDTKTQLDEAISVVARPGIVIRSYPVWNALELLLSYYDVLVLLFKLVEVSTAEQHCSRWDNRRASAPLSIITWQPPLSNAVK